MTKSGCGCTADLKKEVKDLEKAAKAPTKKQHEKKQQELDTAFQNEKKK